MGCLIDIYDDEKPKRNTNQILWEAKDEANQLFYRNNKAFLNYNTYKTYEVEDYNIELADLCGPVFEDYSRLFGALENVRKVLFDQRIALCFKSGGMALKNLPDYFSMYKSKLEKDKLGYFDNWTLYNSFLSIMYNLSVHSKGHVENYKIKFKGNNLYIENPPQVLQEAIERFNKFWKDTDSIPLKDVQSFREEHEEILSKHSYALGQMKRIQKDIIYQLEHVNPFDALNYARRQQAIVDRYPVLVKWYYSEEGYDQNYTKESQELLENRCIEIAEDKQRIIECLNNKEFIKDVNEKSNKILNRKKQEKIQEDLKPEKNNNEEEIKKTDEFEEEPIEKILESPFKVFFEICYEDEVKLLINEAKLLQENPNSQGEMPDLMDKFNKNLIFEYRLTLSTQFGEFALKEHNNKLYYKYGWN